MEVKAFHYTEVEARRVEGAPGTWIRWLITHRDGAVCSCMRLLEVEPGGSTPYHRHPHEHLVYVLEGGGVVRTERGELPLEPGTVVYVPPNAYHCFENTGDGTLKFICVIPVEAAKRIARGS